MGSRSTYRSRGQVAEWAPREFMNYQKVPFSEALEALRRGGHQATVIAGSYAVSLYVTPHREAQRVNPHTVFTGAVVQHNVHPYMSSGGHFEGADALETWLGENSGVLGATYITDSLIASEPHERITI